MYTFASKISKNCPRPDFCTGEGAPPDTLPQRKYGAPFVVQTVNVRNDYVVTENIQ